jgi:hypothetical protein
MLVANPDKIHWVYLSGNPQALHILEKNIDKINWIMLSENPSIFEIDMNQMKIELTKRAKNIDYFKT